MTIPTRNQIQCIGLIPLVLTASLIVGCRVHESEPVNAVTPPESFASDGRAVVPDRWWLVFGDPALNALQAEALSANFELSRVRERLAEARAIVERESAAQFPSLDLSVTAEQTNSTSDDVDSSSQFSGELIATYEVDLWRRIESEIDVVEFQRAVAREEVKAAAIVLSADLATTWYLLVQARGQRAILTEQIETNKQVLEVVKKRFARGQVRASDVLRQERLLESTRQQMAAVDGDIALLEHVLLVLLGRSPTGKLEPDRSTLPDVPEKPATGLPAELLRRRPDVRAAFFSVKAADSAIAAAVADRYPRLTLAVSASVSNDEVVDLFDNWAQSLAASVVAPIFDAGRREAEVERTEAVKRQRVNAYAQTALVAFQDVADAISAERFQKRQIKHIRKQLDLAERTTERLRREYLNGDISYIDVLDALTREQQLERDLLAARFELIRIRIGLYRALAGGWPGAIEPSEAIEVPAAQPYGSE